jgi:ABC-type dipeptide/oligopeptide/nickel transport system permease component
MNAFFEFLKWFIKLSLAATAITFAVIAAFVLGLAAKRRARKAVSDDQ